MARILVVDDDQAVAEVVCMALNDAGHSPKTASSVEDARGALKADAYDGVIIDIWLGQDDGLSLANELQKTPGSPPFIIMSGGGPGRSLETVTARADVLGAASVLYKPFDDDELIAALDCMLGAS